MLAYMMLPAGYVDPPLFDIGSHAKVGSPLRSAIRSARLWGHPPQHLAIRFAGGNPSSGAPGPIYLIQIYPVFPVFHVFQKR